MGDSVLVQSVQEHLGPGGVLERSLPGFMARTGQLAMARLIASALGQEDSVVVAEGGTGIGKTLAYLVPALLSQKKVVVATGTKTLQEQIFFKDFAALKDAAGLHAKAVYMKGRANYLCKLRFEEMAAQQLFRFARDGSYFDTLAEWARTTESGDRAELVDMPEDFASWADLTSTSESCLGSRCRYFDRCFITRMRKQAQAADLIIVNHHLYFADLALRERAMGEVIPQHELVIFDEAQGLEGVATQAFGTMVSNWRLFDLCDDILRWSKDVKLRDLSVGKHLEELRVLGSRFFDTFQIFGERFRFDPRTLDADCRAAYEPLEERLDLLKHRLIDLGVEHAEAPALAERTAGLWNEFEAVLSRPDEKFAYWGEQRKRGVFLYASPLAVSEAFRARFFAHHRQAVFTSATLSCEGRLDFFKKRLGLPDECFEGVFPSPFDYRHRTLLYIPRHMPEPQEANFQAKCAEQIERLIGLTHGAALVLFTSYANMEDVARRLEGRLKVPLLKQGDAPRTQLLEQFRARADSVLLATGSFWQGVDVVGEALRLVIIDKLPFESPGEPLIEARIAYLKSLGRNPFGEVQLPTAILQLKQGVGRLIRSSSDWGLIVILDKRLVGKPYGKSFLKSLPEALRVDRFDQVEQWWQRKAEQYGKESDS